MTEIRATDHVHDLVDSGDVSKAIADRLDDAGYETVADLLIADQADLEDVPYVGEQRAAEILDVVDAVEKPEPEPRDIDLEATESVVSEAAIPLSVRRGEAVLVGKGNDHVYHTRACACVTSDRSTKLKERSHDWVDRSKYRECKLCADPDTHAEHGKQAALTSADPDPLVDLVDVVVEATLGEKLQITLAERDAWAKPWTVIDDPEPVEWESGYGDNWYTRRLRMSDSASGTAKKAREFDLVLAGDEIRVEDPPVTRQSAQPDAPGWCVESVGAVGRVSTSSLIQLQATDEEDAKPEGDDSWRKYQNRGEVA